MDPSHVVSQLLKEDIIPDVVSSDFLPTVFFTPVWLDGKEATLGNFLTREDTLEEPQIHLHSRLSAEAFTASYTLVMTDPDAPSRADPKYRQFRHWVITGLKIPPIAESSTLIETQTSTTPYRPPGPPPGSKVHRYSQYLV
ncbi:hypothetical protein C0993_011371 [Termitomyces sp. T159_Od127]|nr:hypothetical protein C0993_011371 [Termitomyces sp. T159_Od127]